MKVLIGIFILTILALFSCNPNNPQPNNTNTSTNTNTNTTPLPCETVSWKSNINYGTLNDIDGNSYKTVQIGSQTWMAENLKTTKYSNGDDILTISPIGNTTQWYGIKIGATTSYEWLNANNDTVSYKNCFGNYYNFYAVSDNRNVCPTGWHVPTKNDFKKLLTFAGTAVQTSSTSTSLKALEGWTNGNGTDDFGFRAMPAGYKNGVSYGNELTTFTTLNNIGDALFWSSDTIVNSSSGTTGATFRSIVHLRINTYNYLNNNALLDSLSMPIYNYAGIDQKLNGLSIRCVKN